MMGNDYDGFGGLTPSGYRPCLAYIKKSLKLISFKTFFVGVTGFEPVTLCL